LHKLKKCVTASIIYSIWTNKVVKFKSDDNYGYDELAALLWNLCKFYIQSVGWIVALKMCCEYGRACNYGRALMQIGACMQIRIVFTWLKPYFNIRALIFYVCEGSSQPIANFLFITKHAKNYGISIFDYEGHNLRQTR